MSLSTDIQTEQFTTTAKLNVRADLHRRFGTNPQPWNEWVFSQLPLREGARVLDIGCGTGALWLENLKRLPSDIDLTLTDHSFGMTQNSQNTLGSAAEFRFSQADVQTLPFADNSFDLITANHVIFFVPNIQQALREMKRVLRPGGWLTATTNGRLHMQALYDLVSKVKDTCIDTLFGGEYQGPGRFAFDNGTTMLSECFNHPAVVTYPANLQVTEAQPLIDYIETLWRLTEAEYTLLIDLIETEISKNGHFFIDKVQGMLQAQKPQPEENDVDLV